MADIVYFEGGPELLDSIEELWHLLNRHHLERSEHFRQRFEGKTFAARKEEILSKAAGGNVLVHLAHSTSGGGPVAYCVSVIDGQQVGEVESIYVQLEFRGRGIGGELMRRSLAWMDARRVVMKRVEVAWGNQDVLDFYEKLGLYPRRVVLESLK